MWVLLFIFSIVAFLVLLFVPSGPKCPMCDSHATQLFPFDSEGKPVPTLACFHCRAVIEDFKDGDN